MNTPKKLKYFAGGEWLESKTDKYMDVFNPSTGEVLAHAHRCTKDEVEYAIKCAQYPGSKTRSGTVQIPHTSGR